MRHPFIGSVAQTIEREQLCSLDDHLYVALSGGSDSVALLLALMELGYRVSALHCNFALRGKASDGDEAFVRALCLRLGIALEVAHYDTRSYAHEQGLSIEMAARELRYEWFAEVSRREPRALIAIAHNAQDQVETLLLNLINGTGLRGLSGMPYRRDRFIRPMMDTLPELVIDYLGASGQDWRHDESNDDETYRRNYVRHTLIPAIEQVNGTFVNNALRSISNLRGAERFYREAIDRARDTVMQGQSISIGALMRSAHPETLLFELLRPYGFSGGQCRLVVDSLPLLPSGKSFYASSSKLVRSWDVLEIIPIARERMELEIAVIDAGRVETPWGLLTMHLVPRGEIVSLRCSPLEALFDWDRLKGNTSAPLSLTLRYPREGERMRPLGLRGTKLISRIFIDKRVPHSRRLETPLLLIGDTPLWLVGYASSDDYCITECTEMVLALKMYEVGDREAY